MSFTERSGNRGSALSAPAPLPVLELDQLGLGALGDAQPALLGSSQSRLARIAAALVRRPRLCVIDPPEESLSERQIEMLSQRLRAAARIDRTCVVLSTEHSRPGRIADTTLSLPKQCALAVRA